MPARVQGGRRPCQRVDHDAQVSRGSRDGGWRRRRRVLQGRVGGGGHGGAQRADEGDEPVWEEERAGRSKNENKPKTGRPPPRHKQTTHSAYASASWGRSRDNVCTTCWRTRSTGGGGRGGSVCEGIGHSRGCCQCGGASRALRGATHLGRPPWQTPNPSLLLWMALTGGGRRLPPLAAKRKRRRELCVRFCFFPSLLSLSLPLCTPPPTQNTKPPSKLS